MIEYYNELPQSALNITEKQRANLFAWRGQFSPQLVESLLNAYCPQDAVVLDPFSGSGTVLYEAARLGLSAYGFEINPSAWSFSKVFELINHQRKDREAAISELREHISAAFPLFFCIDEALPADTVRLKISNIGGVLSEKAKTIFNALVVLLDIHNSRISIDFVHTKLAALTDLIIKLPYSANNIQANLHDARSMPLKESSIDLVITSPPYINVFNYHQNYRRSVEALGWDVLRVAKSEIGSNRANRGNRFFTVIQYCIDMTATIHELARVLKTNGRAIFIVGHESNVLGTAFYNANILERIARDSGMFSTVLRQKRVFMNRFGKEIREDVLNLIRTPQVQTADSQEVIGRRVGSNALQDALPRVPEKNRDSLYTAINSVNNIVGTPIFNCSRHHEYRNG